VWTEPYLETCCRAALHRLFLCGGEGRPSGAQDEACLQRLSGMGFCRLRADGRFELTRPGRDRHAAEILKDQAASGRASRAAAL
jgi:hypothetical protein